MATNFAKDILELEKEVQALKTAQQLSPRIKCYTYKFTIGSTNYPNGHGRITFESGDNAIVSVIYSDLSIWPQHPTSTTQDFYADAYTLSQFINAPIFVMATRPIVSVQMLD